MTTPQEARSLADRLRGYEPPRSFHDRNCDDAAAMLTEYAALLERQGQEHALIELTRESERLGLYERVPLKRGKTGTCSRTTCQCEAEGLGDECVWLTPLYAAPPAAPLTDDELRTMLPEIDTSGLSWRAYTIDQMIEVMRAVERKVRGQE